ncbi:MAG TPA: VWA-like domain-containing protein [Gallionellaceae bacterium]|nr:VWA-like domain-containing protein [Gallionellaceae bacterium]
MTKPDIETKLAAARTRLILDKPFLGALALRLPLVAADPKWCPTSTTDARSLYYNPDYIDALSLEQTQFVLAREALHCGLSHFARRQHRIKSRWDIACEYSINPVLVKDGLTPPPATIVIAAYEGMTAEEIYPYIKDDDSDGPTEENSQSGQDSDPTKGGSQKGNEQRQGGEGQTPQDSDPQSGGNSQSEFQQELQGIQGAARPDPLSASELDALSTQWQQRMAGAALQAQQAGKLGGALARLVGELLQPKLPWRMLLARYMTQIARDDYSYSRPSRREGEMIMPSLRSTQANIVVVLDTSGSVGSEELGEFLAEINTLKAQLRASITLHACDTVLCKDGPWIFEAWEEFKLPREFHGGGGTDFRPIFDWIERRGNSPDMLLYFTDAKGDFPDLEPSYPVIWLVKGKAPVPWGQRIQLN